MARIQMVRGGGTGDTEGHIVFSVKSAYYLSTMTERLRISASGSITTPNSTTYGTIGASASGSANLPAVKTAINASGSAPIYACRAWVNFDTNAFSPNPSTSAIRGSGNVSSITDNGTGAYAVNFTTSIEGKLFRYNKPTSISIHFE